MNPTRAKYRGKRKCLSGNRNEGSVSSVKIALGVADQFILK